MNYAERQMRFFLMLSAEEKREALAKLSRSGYGPAAIASAAGISVDAARAIIAEKTSQEARVSR